MFGPADKAEVVAAFHIQRTISLAAIPCGQARSSKAKINLPSDQKIGVNPLDIGDATLIMGGEAVTSFIARGT